MGSTNIEVWISLLPLNFNQGRTMHLNLADDELTAITADTKL